MIMYELLGGVGFDELVNASSFQMFYLVLWFVSFPLYRVFLCLTIHSSAKEREVKCRPLWSLLTFLFGIIIPIIYAIVNRKSKAVKQYKSKNIFLVFSIVLIILSYSGGICYNLSNTGEFGPLLNPTAYSDSFDDDFVGAYKNDKGDKVIYDKMGNEYIYDKYEFVNFLYYDENGNSYRWINDMADTLVSIESGKEYKMEDYLFSINKDGYLCIFDYDSESIYLDDSLLFSDDNGNLYYADIGAVYWDEQGNVIFPKFVRECMYLKSK